MATNKFSRKWGKIYCKSWNCIFQRTSEFNGWCCLNCSRDLDIPSEQYSKYIMRCWVSNKLTVRKPELNWWCCSVCKLKNDKQMSELRADITKKNLVRHIVKIQKTAHTQKGYKLSKV